MMPCPGVTLTADDKLSEEFVARILAARREFLLARQPVQHAHCLVPRRFEGLLYARSLPAFLFHDLYAFGFTLHFHDEDTFLCRAETGIERYWREMIEAEVNTLYTIESYVLKRLRAIGVRREI